MLLLPDFLVAVLDFLLYCLNCLKDTYARAPVNWGKMNYSLWSNLDNAVSSRLSEHFKFCDSLSAKVKLLEDSIYEEAVLIFATL